MTMIAVNGEAFHVRVEGPEDAPALLLSNSLSSDLSMWDAQVPAWARHFRVVRYDQRGHGRSVVSPSPCSMRQLGRDAIGILDTLGIAQAHWCGISLGGMIGMWALTHAPERIGRAVLANTSAYMGPPDLWNGRIQAAESGGMAALVDATVQRWFPPHFREQAPDVMVRMREMILATPVEGYRGSCFAIREMDQRETIRSIPNPVLVIIGARDPATPPADGQLIAQAIKDSRTLTLDAAHISNIEQPEAFTKAVMDFLQG